MTPTQFEFVPSFATIRKSRIRLAAACPVDLSRPHQGNNCTKGTKTWPVQEPRQRCLIDALVNRGGKRRQNALSVTTHTLVVTSKPNSTVGTCAGKPKHSWNGKFYHDNTPAKTCPRLMTKIQIREIREHQRRWHCQHARSLVFSLSMRMIWIKCGVHNAR